MYGDNFKFDHRTASNQQVKEITYKLKKLGMIHWDANKARETNHLKVIILTSHVKLDMCTQATAYT